jgi:8-oxo-dGTP pyrophosphatase MutT (NUDIX family)
MKTSCGIILKSDGKYLLGHTNGAGWNNSWTFFKGLVEPGESYEDAAYREFEEETSINLKKLGLPINYLSDYQMKGKVVKVYMCIDTEGITRNLPLKCNSLVRDDYPEIDDFKWATEAEAENMVTKSQKHLFN